MRYNSLMKRIRSSILAVFVFLATPALAWEGSVNLGLTGSSGNSRALHSHLSVEAEQERGPLITRVEADASYARTDGEVSADKLGARSHLNYLVTHRLSAYLDSGVERDRVAGVDRRITAGLGAGYFLVKRINASLLIEAGPSYISQRLDGLDPEGYWSWQVSERAEFKINQRARVWQSLRHSSDIDGLLDRFLLEAEIGIETSISERTNLRLSVQDTYRSEPAPGRERNDLMTIASVGVSF